jgi:adenylylsulfate kinase-like enzyme
LEVCIQRDVKGLYKKALSGEISNYTGIDDAYEEPLHPEVIVETDKEAPRESSRKIILKLEQLGYL